MVMRVGGPQTPSPPSPGRLSWTRTLYPVFGLRFIKVTFSLGSTGGSTHYSAPTSGEAAVLPPFILPFPLIITQYPCPAQPPSRPQLSPAPTRAHPQWRTRPGRPPGAGSAGGQRQWVRPQRRRPAGRPRAGGSAWPGAEGQSGALGALPGDPR